MEKLQIISGDALTAYLAAKPHLTVENIPYTDDVVDKYAVPGWGALTKQIEDPLTPKEQIGTLRTDRAKLFMNAVHHSDVYFGPVREREIESPEPASSLEPGGNPNEWRIVRALKKLGGNLKQHWNNSTSFFKENKGIASASLLVGALAGFGIVTGVHMGTEQVMNGLHAIGLSHPSLDWLIGAGINIGGSWVLNQEVFLNKTVRKWAPRIADSRFRKENELVPYDVLTEQQQKKIELDTKGMVSSVVIGDIGGKFAAAVFPLEAMLHRLGDAFHWFNESVLGHGQQAITPVPENQYTVTPIQPESPNIHPTEIVHPTDGDNGLISPTHLPDTHGVEHIVQGNDEMLTKILVEHGLKPYSGDYIKLLSENKDVFAEMLKKTYPNGNVPVLENLTSNKWNYVSVDQAVKNLNEVIQAGYPDPNKLSGEAYRLALIKMFNSVRYLLPGTAIEIPAP